VFLCEILYVHLLVDNESNSRHLISSSFFRNFVINFDPCRHKTFVNCALFRNIVTVYQFAES
jgi:hypothetical protein